MYVHTYLYTWIIANNLLDFIAFATHMGCYTLLVLVIVYLRWHLKRENKKKDEMAEAGIREARDVKNVHAFEDLTDRENPNFRYIY